MLRRYIVQIWSHCQRIQAPVQIKYAGSEAHVTELLEKVCDNANDYATSTDDNGKCLTIVVYNVCRFLILLILTFADTSYFKIC